MLLVSRARWSAPRLTRALRVGGEHLGDWLREVVGIERQQRHRPEADDESEDVEVADEAGGVEHRLARALASATVKNRIRICGRPAVPNISAKPGEIAEIGSVIQPPGAMIAGASGGSRPRAEQRLG
jgi:hypothetical protein